MNFDAYLNQAWNEHASQSEKLAVEFSQGAALVETNEQLAQLVALVAHVMGEHLGRWSDGVAFLTGLKTHPSFIASSETEKAILRSVATLQIGSGQTHDCKSLSHSDQIRIFAMAASALCSHDSDRAQDLLRKALDLAETKL